MNSEFIIVKHMKKVNLKKPVVIEGLPGVGNVARISVDYLIDKLKAEKWLTVYTHHFPNSVFIGEDKTISLPKMEFYVAKGTGKARDFIFVVGDTQPVEETASYKFSQQIVDICVEAGAEEIVTLGGISSKISIKNPPVFGAVTDKKYIPKLEKAGVKFNREGSVVLVGVAGLMLGLGQLCNLNGFSLLAETSGHPQSVGLDAVESILTVLCSYFNINIPLKDIHKSIEKINKAPLQMKPRAREQVTGKMLPSPEKNLHYIG